MQERVRKGAKWIDRCSLRDCGISGNPVDDEFTDPYNRFLYTGKEFDFETGLTHMDARSYDPTVGRWLQRDPMNLATLQLPPQAQGIVTVLGRTAGDFLLDVKTQNGYAYVANNPFLYVDLTGLEGCGNDYRLLALNERSAGGGGLGMPGAGPRAGFGRAFSKQGLASINFFRVGGRRITVKFRQLNKKFDDHAHQFGVEGNWNPANARQFFDGIKKHVTSTNTQVIKGIYKKQPAIFYYDSKSRLTVITKPDGEFVSGWVFGPKQFSALKSGKDVW